MTTITEQIKTGLLYLKNKDYSKAENFFLHLVRKNPTNIQLYSYLIPAMISQRKFKDALNFAEKLHNLNKNNELGLIYKGIINYNLENYNIALDFFKKSIFINPKSFDALLNIGVTFRKLGENAKAIKYFYEAADVKDDKSIVFYNLGSIYEEECDLDKAISYYKKAISINNRDYDSIHAISLCQLTMQNYEDGFKNYECRWFKNNFEKYRYQDIARLRSLDSISEKKILIWYEQGLGDTIQFSRYINLLINLGANVTFEVQEPLLNFLKRQFNCEVTQDASKGNFDFQCPLMSLPYLFKMNIENIPKIDQYFKCNDEKVKSWRNILNLSKDKKNLGIAISGNMNQVFDYRRKIDLECFLTLNKHFKIFIIQKSLYQKDEILLNKTSDIIFLGKHTQWRNFDDTSAIVKNMDCIISIDTSLVHLAGSINKNTFLLLSEPADWRWSHETLNSPKWYENVTIIRKKNKNNWIDTISELQKKLI